MKGKLLILFIVSTCFLGNVLAQNYDIAVGRTIGGTAKDVSRFSFGIKGGIDYLRVSDRNINPEAGAFMEISVSPLWGFGLEYMYLMNDHDATAFSRGYKLTSTVQDITLYGSVNVSNLISKYRSQGWQKWNLYANLGGGVSIYDWELKDAEEKGDGIRPVVLAGMALEYNAAKWLAFGLEGQYRFHSAMSFIGDNGGSSDMLGANISVRFKFGGDKNVRNMAVVDYDPQVKVIKKASAKRRHYAKIVAQVKAQKAAIAKMDTLLTELQGSLDSLKNILSTPAGYYAGDENLPKIETVFFRVEFESGKNTIKPAYHAALNELARVLIQSQGTVLLRGHADSVGNSEANIRLSQERANSTKDYLVKKGVSSSAVQTRGYGSAHPISSNSTSVGRAQNRRVEIVLYSK